jgi:hypothetical protein
MLITTDCRSRLEVFLDKTDPHNILQRANAATGTASPAAEKCPKDNPADEDVLIDVRDASFMVCVARGSLASQPEDFWQWWHDKVLECSVFARLLRRGRGTPSRSSLLLYRFGDFIKKKVQETDHGLETKDPSQV